MTAEGTEAAVELRDVGFSYVPASGAPIRVLEHFTLSVRPGEIVALIGPSGCGKTTILKIVAGLLEPNEGMVSVRENRPAGNRRRCGYVPQNYSLFPWLTVKKNIEYGLRFIESSHAKIAETSSHLLAVTGLQEFADAYPGALSGGMRQRVAIARALAVDPAVVLLDEPFGALDFQTRSEVQKYFLDLMQVKSKAAILVTHDIQEAILLSDLVVVLSQRPGSVLRQVQIPLARPRTYAIRDSEQVLSIYRAIVQGL